MTDDLVEAVIAAIAPHFSSAQRAYGDDRDAACAALSAVEAAGYVIVPKQPTPEMVKAASWVRVDPCFHIYEAMLSARPKQEDET